MVLAWAALAQAPGALEQLSPLTQAGVLVGLLAIFGFVIKTLFGQMIKSKDAEIAAAYKELTEAKATAARYEAKLDHQQEVIQTQILSTLKDASTTTLEAFKIIRGNP